uniref:GLPGLI family protein n=1 Tax=Flavobacterium sp. TaxID=239 RepID=UPI00404AEAAA
MQNLKFSLTYLFLIYFCFNLWGQNQNSLVTYHTFCAEDEAFLEMGKKAYNQYKQEVEQQEFQLIFNDSLSHFYTNSTIELSLPIINIYKQKTVDFAYKPLKEEKILLKLARNQTWEFSNEIKKIGHFTCYKATSSYTVVRGNKIMNFPIIAWFTPEIPFGFGPLGYGGLPGLILELQVRNITYGAQKIVLKNSTQIVEFPIISDFKTMTEQDWEAMVLKRMLDE